MIDAMVAKGKFEGAFMSLYVEEVRMRTMGIMEIMEKNKHGQGRQSVMEGNRRVDPELMPSPCRSGSGPRDALT